MRDSKKGSYLKLCDELENDPWGKAYKTVVKRVNAGNISPTDPAVLEGIVQVLCPEGRPIPSSDGRDKLGARYVRSRRLKYYLWQET